MKTTLTSLAASCFLAAPAFTQDTTDFVEANILGIFYHELGHAVIDLEELPIFWPRRRCGRCVFDLSDRRVL